MSYVWLYKDVVVYGSHQAGFYVGVFEEVYSYVYSYDDLGVYDGCEAGFL